MKVDTGSVTSTNVVAIVLFNTQFNSFSKHIVSLFWDQFFLKIFSWLKIKLFFSKNLNKRCNKPILKHMNNSCDMLVIYVGTAALKLQPIFAFNVDFSLVKSFEPITRFVYISMYDFSKTFVILLTKVKQTSKQDSIQHYSSTDLVIFIISIAIQLKLTLLLLVKNHKIHTVSPLTWLHTLCTYSLLLFWSQFSKTTTKSHSAVV